MGIGAKDVIVGILIVVTVGFSQNADATHVYGVETGKYLKLHPEAGVISCDVGDEKFLDSSSDFIILPAIRLDENIHEKCVLILSDEYDSINKVINYGTLVINPTSKPVLHNGILINYGTVIINPIPAAPEEKQKEYHEDFLSTWGTMFLPGQEYKPPPEGWPNFVNRGTIINYGYIENNGVMISFGKIINKGSVGLFDPSGSIRNHNLLVNYGEPLENGGGFHNYYGIFQSTTAIHDYCGSITQNPSTSIPKVGIIHKCVPVTFEKPVDKWLICENQHPTFEWTDSDPWASQTYKFWLTPHLTPEFILEEAWLPKGGNYDAWSY